MPLQKVAFLPVIIALALSSACSRVSTSNDFPLDATVDVEQTDREVLGFRRASADTARDVGSRMVRAEPAHRTVPAAPAYREITIPADTVLEVELKTPLASDESRREDHVGAQTLGVVVIDGEPVVPEGSTLIGSVVEARQAGRVQGRAVVAIRFDRLQMPGTASAHRIRSETVRREAEATKRDDAVKIGAPAAGAALIGGLFGGKKGALIGGVVGAGAGTAVVLSTSGDEVRLAAGTPLSVRLVRPLTVVVPSRRVAGQ